MLPIKMYNYYYLLNVISQYLLNESYLNHSKVMMMILLSICYLVYMLGAFIKEIISALIIIIMFKILSMITYVSGLNMCQCIYELYPTFFYLINLNQYL